MNVFFQNLIFAIADAGMRCTVISPVSVVRYKTRIKDFPYHCIHKTPLGSDVDVYYPKVLSASSKQIGKFNTEVVTERLFERGALRVAKKLTERFDAVYGHFFLYGGLAAIKIGRKLCIPSFVAFGECDYETQVQQTYDDLTHKDVDGVSGIIAVSTKNANVLKQLGLFDNTPIIIAPNGVNKKEFYKKDKTECRRILGLPEDKFIVGFVGGFIPRKGNQRLLEAVSQLPDVYLAFAGRGNEPPSGDRVLFCEAMKHEEVVNLLNAVDVFCLPTLSEGSCNAVIEAMSCGVPVISSALPFNDDVLSDDNSIRLDPMSISQIRDAILLLKENTEKRNKIAENGYKTAHELNIDKRAKKILCFIDKILYNSKKY